jgi:hypothetical protein
MEKKIMSLKQLYFLHIPKTAGRFVSENILNSVNNKDCCYFTTGYQNNSEGLESKIYISAHSGTYPIDLLKNIDVATVVRDPVSARASYFNFIYPRLLKDRLEYQNIKNDKEKFLYYLFYDKEFLIHNNYQSNFLCNSSDPRSWNTNFFNKKGKPLLIKKYNEGQNFNWFIGNENTSLDNAINNINKFKIVNTLDNIEMFCNSIKSWFLLNHSIEIKFDFNNKINVSISEFNNKKTSSEYFVNLLNQNEKDRILELNSVDLEVYNFVKNKEATNV